MKKGKLFIGMALTVLIAVQAACNLPSAEKPDPAATLNALYTQSAQTLEAMATQAEMTSVNTQPVASSTTTSSTSTPIPGFNTPTGIPYYNTPIPVSRCDWADFVTDVSYPDGSVVGRGSTFTKTWRLKNIGTCTWTTNYALVFVDGDSMNAPAAVSLPGNVNPGQTVDLQVNLTAPSKNGYYKGYFKLRNASGLLFGVGDSATTPFWVAVNVSGVSYVAYDFATNYCDAQWDNGKKVLPCPGTQGDNDGYVIEIGSPKFENGQPANRPGLLTFPRDAANGMIRGTYPPITVVDGDRFRSVVNCRYNSAGCNVIFRLDYQIGNGSINNLGQWNEAYEGLSYSVDIDLSSLAGYNVKFILTVLANGDPTKDFALWIGPQILRQGTPPPTPTPTPTFTATATPTATATATATATETATATTTTGP